MKEKTPEELTDELVNLILDERLRREGDHPDRHRFAYAYLTGYLQQFIVQAAYQSKEVRDMLERSVIDRL